MTKKLQLAFWLQSLILTFSSNALGVEIGSCIEGKAIVCVQSGYFGVYYDCLTRKKALLNTCIAEMNGKIKSAQGKILNKIDAEARNEGEELDSTQNMLQFHISQIEKINQENEPRFAKMRGRFASFVVEYEKSFRPAVTELEERYLQFGKDVNQIIEKNSYDNRTDLQRLSVKINSRYAQDINSLATMRSKVIFIREEFKFFTENYRLSIQEHLSYLNEHGHVGLVFDMNQYSDLLTRADNGVIKSIDELNAAHDNLIKRIDSTTHDLIEQFVFNKTKQIIDDTNHMVAATAFLNQVNSSIKKSFVDLKSQTFNGVPLFALRYVAMTDFIAFARICEGQVSAPWMKTGCSFALDKLSAARITIKQMPSNMQLGLMLAATKASGPQIQKIAEIKKQISSNNLGQATLIYDEMVKEVFR